LCGSLVFVEEAAEDGSALSVVADNGQAQTLLDPGGV
jgi:hypothetical protein